ncbi:hypothetical protein [Neorhodopirellula pilleata]|nr:hypothetical protein [Neorhodopirellula pilleata]
MRQWTTQRKGASLIDVAVGAAVLSLVLIPAMQLMGKSTSLVSDMTVKEALLFEAERAIQMQMIELCDVGVFDLASSPGDRPVTDNHSKQYRTRTRLIRDPQIANLLTIHCVAYQDANANGRLDADELEQTLQTQWCRPS